MPEVDARPKVCSTAVVASVTVDWKSSDGDFAAAVFWAASTAPTTAVRCSSLSHSARFASAAVSVLMIDERVGRTASVGVLRVAGQDLLVLDGQRLQAGSNRLRVGPAPS